MELGPLTLTPAPAVRHAAVGAPLELLQNSEFCKGLNDDDLRTFAELMRPVNYEPGQFIFKQGTPPDGLYLMESGEALFWTRIGDQRKELVRFVAGNTLCGSVLFERSGRIASCEATMPSRVWLLDIEAFQGLRAHRHEAIFRLSASSAMHLGDGFTRMISWAREALKLDRVAGGAPTEPLVLQPISEANQALLKVVPWVKHLSPDFFGRLVGAGRWVEVKRGHHMMTEGGPPAELLMVVRGALEVSANTTAGKVRFGLRGPGRWAAHESFFSRNPQFADVTAKENTQLVAFDRGSIDALLDKRDPLILDLFEQVTADIALQFDQDSRALYRQLFEGGFNAITRADIDDSVRRQSPAPR